VVFECVPDESVYNPIGVMHAGRPGANKKSAQSVIQMTG